MGNFTSKLDKQCGRRSSSGEKNEQEAGNFSVQCANESETQWPRPDRSVSKKAERRISAAMRTRRAPELRGFGSRAGSLSLSRGGGAMAVRWPCSEDAAAHAPRRDATFTFFCACVLVRVCVCLCVCVYLFVCR